MLTQETLVADLWILKSLLLEVSDWLLVHPSLVCSPGSASIDPTVPLPCTVSTHNLQAHFRALYLYPFNSRIANQRLCFVLCGTGACGARGCPEEHWYIRKGLWAPWQRALPPLHELFNLHRKANPVRCDLEGLWGTRPCGGDGDFTA